ncbi:hypothetical protein [Nocardia sp. NPDC049149]|uniref:hypothetical protein n=1 Tax=Nocardia sp. NPDC049149 TaxID=3364315 RepID=UPI00371781E5
MTGTPPPPPHESAGDAPDHGDDERHAAQPGQHESQTAHPAEPSSGHGRHEMAGPAGYPQFEGPGAAQYGDEPVEPPPPVTPQQPSQQSAQAGYAPPKPEYGQQHGGQPTYGQPQSEQGQPQPGYAAPHSGYGQPEQGQPQPGYGQPTYAAPQPTYGQPQPEYGQPQPGQAAPEPSYGQPGTGPGTMPPPGASGTAPPPTYGYQQAAVGVPGTLDVGQAISYGWEKFRSNPGPWIGVTAVGLLIYLAFVAVVQLTDPRSILPVLLIFLAVMVGVWLLQAAMVRGALYETDGTKPPFGAYFRFMNAGNVLLTALLAFVATSIGSAFCVLPGLIVGILCMFSIHFVVDQDQGPFEALRSSATLVVTNVWPVLLLALSVLFVTLVGVLLCGIGLLVAGPVAVIAVTYAYRTLTGGVVSALQA